MIKNDLLKLSMIVPYGIENHRPYTKVYIIT